jgi:hypothetical protein
MAATSMLDYHGAIVIDNTTASVGRAVNHSAILTGHYHVSGGVNVPVVAELVDVVTIPGLAQRRGFRLVARRGVDGVRIGIPAFDDFISTRTLRVLQTLARAPGGIISV